MERKGCHLVLPLSQQDAFSDPPWEHTHFWGVDYYNLGFQEGSEERLERKGEAGKEEKEKEEDEQNN